MCLPTLCKLQIMVNDPIKLLISWYSLSWEEGGSNCRSKTSKACCRLVLGTAVRLLLKLLEGDCLLKVASGMGVVK